MNSTNQFLKGSPSDDEIFGWFIRFETPETCDQLKPLGCDMWKIILNGKADEYDTKIVQEIAESTGKGKWTSLTSGSSEELDAGVGAMIDKTGAGKYYKLKGSISLVVTSPHLIEWISDKISVYYDEVVKVEVVNKVTTGRGRKSKAVAGTYDTNYIGDKLEPQGSEYKYFLKLGSTSDEDGVFAKDQGKIRVVDGKQIRDKRWKSTKREVPFLSCGTCTTAISWDRATGSKVLRDASMSGSFRMCCPSKPMSNGKCSKHQTGTENFFEGKYKGGCWRGMSYVEFISMTGGNSLGDGVREWIEKDFSVRVGAELPSHLTRGSLPTSVL